MQKVTNKKYRPLSDGEQQILIANGCMADSWERIMVAEEGFTPENIRRCRFKGDVRIGADVTIKDVSSFIANYEIGDRVKIVNMGILETRGVSSFGNGTKVATINENGGRTVCIYDGLTAQSAYVCALYRHRPQTVNQLQQIALRYTEQVSSTMGTIGDGARLCDCKIIRNVNIGPAAEIFGASILQNGTILSSEESKTEVGVDVKMYDFIVQDSSSVDNSSLLRRCFVGQGVIIENLTASDSLIFAGSHMENCEACSIFAGPYTVSHHSSSLLIAGLFSFFNAGSGTNQSNHLFRTGAVHQGIHLRGVKFGSNAYTMLPCRNGAFTVVVGRHRNYGDTDSFPYSYLVEKEGASWLMPGRNLMSYGTVRDLKKWPQRDRRKGTRNDNINFQECNPYIAVRFLKAIEILSEMLEAEGGEGPDVINWGRMKIERKAAWQGKRLYTTALYKFLGSMLSLGEAKEGLSGAGHWIDCAGQFMPLDVMNEILSRVDSGEIDSSEALKVEFDRVMDNYDHLAHSWALTATERLLGHAPTEEDIRDIIARGKECAAELESTTNEDRQKDFGIVATVGYGIDCLTEEERLADFNAVRER